MSAEATGWVWRNSPYSGGSLNLHLALADVANDTHGNELWMSVATMAAKARLSERQIQRVLRDMVDKGYLKVLSTEHGKTVHYRFLMPVDKSARGVTFDAPGGDIRRVKGVTPTSPELKKNSNERGGASQMRAVQPSRYVPDLTPGEPMPPNIREGLTTLGKHVE